MFLCALNESTGSPVLIANQLQDDPPVPQLHVSMSLIPNPNYIPEISLSLPLGLAVAFFTVIFSVLFLCCLLLIYQDC